MTDDALWYKDAVIYELHIRAFHDSDGDGLGDFPGLTQKLDYLEDLGVTVIWLLPFYPSPLKDDGYDIADYMTVNPQYGTLDDFKAFLADAHRRGMKVITELVINHTSDQHPWFQRARHAPKGSSERDFYVWNDTDDKYPGVGIMFPEFEPSNWEWDHVAKQYYWHRFYRHQPDLNYDNPAVWDAIFPVVDFWLGLGVDGMRLDAVPYLYERDGTSCEHLPETHNFLKKLREHVDARFPNRMFLGEANAWPEDMVAYFGDGDECQMAFHFPLMPRLFMAVQQEDRFPIIDIFAQTPAIPDNCQWCLFLRNHDEMTLAMVTDEERDYMYRAYTTDRQAKLFLGIRHRLAPLLKNDRRRVELMNALLFSLPGSPVIYYGDEIGMGDNIYLGDRNGVRTPMQWSSDRNAGFSRANPQRLFLPIVSDPEYHYEAINVEGQQNNPNSLLWWMKRMIALRKRFQAFGRGTIEFLKSDNPKVLAFTRLYEKEVILVVANLSRFVQPVHLDLRDGAGLTPEELFGGAWFPPITEQPYPLTLGPHGFYWFALAKHEAGVPRGPGRGTGIVSAVRVHESWTELTDGIGQDDLELVLPAFLQSRQPGAGPTIITACRILHTFAINPGGREVRLLIVTVEFRLGVPETVFLPVAFLADGVPEPTLVPVETVTIAAVQGPRPGRVIDALALPDYSAGVIEAIHQNRTFAVRAGSVRCVCEPAPEELFHPDPKEAPPVLTFSDRNNLSVKFGQQLVLKSFRRVEAGLNPHFEIARHLAEQKVTNLSVPLVGHIEWQRSGVEPATLAVLHQYVPNQGTAWELSLSQLSLYFEQVAALSQEQRRVLPPIRPLDEPILETDATAQLLDLIGGYRLWARQLGTRAAALHAALAAPTANANFAPEPFTKVYRRSIYQAMRTIASQLCQRLEREMPTLPESVQAPAQALLVSKDALLTRFRQILDSAIDGYRIRIHGDYHLGQLLYTGNDFMVVDFEGDTSRTIGERRIKRSPIRDIASMLHSFDYAARAVLYQLGTTKSRAPGVIRSEDVPVLESWADAWINVAGREFYHAYAEHPHTPPLLPTSRDARETLLQLTLLDKCLHEVDYDLNTRPAWAAIPLRAAVQLLQQEFPAPS
ncbi:maltose alpha-D-glucosyltransferase [Limnoglobus roseus]|uniref:maltose alpha-D-glucosyltransferase n=1 Tax=Limnoglobus roseus TaxID=2598579 RepID=A0A5C1AK27_9BACT|nr:maltose alpha-D-glucosyltransferase [Limnoglobus roseus]QEL19749.1 trehalose synthase [Limnoglobus roseus]